MNDLILQEAQRTISSRRLYAKSENERRYCEINEKIPQIAEINRQLAQTAIKILDTLKEGENVQQRLEVLQRQNLEAQEISAKLLQSYGYPSDYLDMHYTCEQCQDTGYANGGMCDCLKKLFATLAVNKMNEHAQLSLSSFDQFSLEYYRNKTDAQNNDCYTVMESILRACQGYAQKFSEPSVLWKYRSWQNAPFPFYCK